jgi:hypothetical protein
MNQLDHYVTKVLGLPYKEYDRWWVPVECECEGWLTRTNIMCADHAHALSVKVGDKFVA